MCPKKIVAKTKVWVVPDSKLDKQGQNEQQISITIKPKFLYEYLKNIDNFYEDLRKELKASNQSFLEITYEDLFGRESEVTKAKILEFIGVLVKPECLTSNLKKQNLQKLSQLIENFSELEEALKGTELEPYLYAPDF